MDYAIGARGDLICAIIIAYLSRPRKSPDGIWYLEDSSWSGWEIQW